jgi:predicted house-cleaning noncanonical NTP pyrophosphatase (MazG superfamily)
MAERETFDKLVRDEIPAVIEDSGEAPETHVATGEEYRRRLHEKLDEEVTEFHDDPCAGELADVREVLDALQGLHDIDEDAVASARDEKADERGRFEDGVVLDAVER